MFKLDLNTSGTYIDKIPICRYIVPKDLIIKINQSIRNFIITLENIESTITYAL
jgi:hypothetical protein